VHATDAEASATFLSEVLGLAAPRRFGPFLVVDAANGASLDYLETPEVILVEHYAFLVTEDEFDEIFGRIRQRGLGYWADPHLSEPGEINHHDGGRGVYFEDPDGHILEIITRPYGSGS
jgi:catechol 2,3-dioxygenase-like lactoylglutathione lyase family enzyme